MEINWSRVNHKFLTNSEIRSVLAVMMHETEQKAYFTRLGLSICHGWWVRFHTRSSYSLLQCYNVTMLQCYMLHLLHINITCYNVTSYRVIKYGEYDIETFFNQSSFFSICFIFVFPSIIKL